MQNIIFFRYFFAKYEHSNLITPCKVKNPQDWDAEVYEYVEIQISATDNPGKTTHNPPTTENIRIYIGDINDNDPEVVEYERQITVGELAAIGSDIGTDNFGGKYSFRVRLHC